MEWTPYRLTLAIVMLITGSINTLSAKWADRQESVGVDGKKHPYNHPFVQAVGMFMGELSCLFVYLCVRFRSRRSAGYRDVPADGAAELPFNPLIFLPPALCDMCATSTMYIGLNLTFASSFQMLRGAVMIFTALFSVCFLRRRILSHMWFGMAMVFVGLVLVGVADIVLGDSDTGNNGTGKILLGDMLIIVAQLIVATQMVYEEKFVARYNVPALKAVGLEGLFGFIMLGLVLIPLYFITSGGKPLEDTKDAFIQMGNNYIIIIATIGNILSIAFFNFSGISVTKEMSATTRMVLDSCRTLIIWVFGYIASWQAFNVGEFFTQFMGFVMLVIGMLLYNDLVIMPCVRRHILMIDADDEHSVNRQRGSDDEEDENTPILRNAASASYDDNRSNSSASA